MDFDYDKYKKTTIVKLPLVILSIVIPVILELALIPHYISTFGNFLFLYILVLCP